MKQVKNTGDYIQHHLYFCKLLEFPVSICILEECMDTQQLVSKQCGWWLVAGCRGCNLNIILAISPGVGVVYQEVHMATVNAQMFAHFLDNLSDIVEDQDITEIMDNAPVHNHATMRHPNHQLLKLLPYSPMLQPH